MKKLPGEFVQKLVLVLKKLHLVRGVIWWFMSFCVVNFFPEVPYAHVQGNTKSPTDHVTSEKMRMTLTISYVIPSERTA